MRRLLRLFIIVLPVAVLLGCAADDDAISARNRKVALLLEQGKAQLGRNEWSAAKATFESVLAKYDNANNQARFGSALADILFLSDGLRYLTSIGKRASTGLLPTADDESRYLTELIDQAILDVRLKFASADHHLGIVEKDSHFTFRIDSLPLALTVDQGTSIDFGGEWDQADALFLHGLVQVLLGGLDLVSSVDLSFDFPRAHAYLVQPGFDAGNSADLMSLLTYLLNDSAYPNFLGLKADGAATLNRAAHALSSGARNFEQALYAASRERDDQSDDILRYGDENGNDRFDPPFDAAADACTLREAAQSNPDAAEFFSLAGMRLRNHDNQALLNQQLLCLLQKTAANLNGTHPGGASTRARLNLMADLIPVIDAVLAGVSTQAPNLTFGVPVPEGVVTTAAQAFVGNAVELDPYAFFVSDSSGKPGSLRALLPVWEKVPCPASGPCLNSFAIEMECSPQPVTQAAYPAPITEVFVTFELGLPVCQNSWVNANQMQDTGHFQGAIAADGIVGYLPYIQFQDPSLHGVLYLNPGATAALFADSTSGQDAEIAAGLKALDGDPKDFKKATLLQLNALAAALSSNSTVGGLLLEFADRL